MPMNPHVTPLFAPTAAVYQLNVQNTTDELVLAQYSYSFYRRIRWKNIMNWYKDQRYESMPQQLLQLEEFVITRDHWTQNEIDYIQQFVNDHKGAAYPFFFTAPDDGFAYQVRFNDDFGVVLSDAVARKGQLTLVAAGDLNNSINDGLVYPPYVQSTTTTISTTTTSTGSTTTSSTSFTPSDAQTTVLSAVKPSDSGIIVSSDETFNEAGLTTPFDIQVSGTFGVEIMTVTAWTPGTNAFSVTRGVDGTTPLAFQVGDPVTWTSS